MKWEISNKQNKTRLAVITALVAFGTIFLLTGALMTQVYGVTPEQEELGTNEDGDKKSYTDCEGYKEYTERMGITKENADYHSKAVDSRINNLSYSINSNPGSEDREALTEERDCLSAIRAIENEAMVEMAEIANDISEIVDLYSQQQSINERFEELKEKKYD